MSKKNPVELEDQRELGRRLREHRNRLNLTRGTVAEFLETSELMVQRLEAGTAILTIPRLLKLAQAFRVPPATLLQDLSPFEAHEHPAYLELTADEKRLLAAWHSIDDKVQKRNILDMLERMKD